MTGDGRGRRDEATRIALFVARLFHLLAYLFLVVIFVITTGNNSDYQTRRDKENSRVVYLRPNNCAARVSRSFQIVII